MRARLASAVALLAASGCAQGCGPRSSPAPSLVPASDRVVVIVVDTLRKDHLPFYGYARDTTPFLGRLARESYVFDHAFAASSWTAPATASLFTSLYPFQHGVITGINVTRHIQRSGYQLPVNRIPEEAETLGEVMREAGYETFGISANMNVIDTQGFTQGFDSFVTMWGVPARRVTAHLERLRPRLLAAKKYFLYLHYMDPHAPYRERGDAFDASLTGRARTIAAYDSEIVHCDTHIQKMARALGWRTNALVIFTADHGEAFGEHGASGHGNNLFGETLNVPLFIHPPGGLPSARRFARPVSHLDVLPTLREMVGLPGDPRAEGVSLLPLLRGKRRPRTSRTLYAHLYRVPGNRGPDRETVGEAALRDGWKWVGGTGAHGLFDLAHDPDEVDDRTARRPELAKALAKSYHDFERRADKLDGASGTLHLDEEDLDRLKTLGYAN